MKKIVQVVIIYYYYYYYTSGNQPTAGTKKVLFAPKYHYYLAPQKTTQQSSLVSRCKMHNHKFIASQESQNHTLRRQPTRPRLPIHSFLLRAIRRRRLLFLLGRRCPRGSDTIIRRRHCCRLPCRLSIRRRRL